MTKTKKDESNFQYFLREKYEMRVKLICCHSKRQKIKMGNLQLVGILGMHVDDVLGGVVDEKFVKPLRDRFQWG